MPDGAQWISENPSNYINKTSREYGIYVLENRAIPALTDGLKLSQRIALWLLRDRASDIKTVALAGEMISSKLYVHGDASAADAISRLAAPYLNNHCLIRGEGAFGTRVAPVDGIGAPRYTEVGRSDFAREHLYVDMEFCPMRENYDGSTRMPATFLPRLPLILLNGIKGLATGWSSTILPRRLSDIQKAVLEVLRDGYVSNPLKPHFEQYDCPISFDDKKSRWVIDGRVNRLNTTTVEITELPPDITLEKVKENLIKLEDEKKITSFTDNSTDKISITVKLPRATLANYNDEGLINFFKLRSYETERLTVLDPSGTRVVLYETPQEMVKDFVNWRLEWYLTRYERLLAEQEDIALFWFCFLACFEKSGDYGYRSVAQDISDIKSRADLVARVEDAIKADGLELRSDIVNKIVGFPVYRFTEEGQHDAQKALEDAEKLITEYSEIVSNPNKRKKVYQSEVKKLRMTSV